MKSMTKADSAAKSRAKGGAAANSKIGDGNGQLEVLSPEQLRQKLLAEEWVGQEDQQIAEKIL